MNIPEAIKVLEQERRDHHSFPTDVIGQAEQLASEALKRILDIRLYDHHDPDALLPGETRD